MEYKDRIKAARRHAKLTQEALADVVGIKQASISELETGKSLSSSFNASIAKACGVDAVWLETGRGQMLSESSNVVPGPEVKGRVPLISWVQAGSWCEAVDNYHPGDAEEWLPCPFAHSDGIFCLQVQGQSMAPDYREGEIIAVDPEIDAVHGNDVVCRTPDGKTTFKRLQITTDGTYLLALNPDWPERLVHVPDDTHICGVVIGSWMRRR